MTTVGYGDYYPITLPGYLTASAVMLIGMVITALPIAIIGENFSTYYKYGKKREKRATAAAKKKDVSEVDGLQE